MPPEMRLQKFMAECGVASRRQAEKLILSGRVRVNGKTVTKLGTKIDPEVDKVKVEDQTLKQKENKVYIKLNKPPGYVSSCRKFKGERTILDLVRDVHYRLYPVGRLDRDSEGLMLLTNDGKLAHRLMHPRYEHEKEYIINAECRITNDELMKIESGIVIDGKKTLSARVKRLGERQFKIALKEGRKRQIRKMLEAIGNKIIRLKRVRIKNVRLGDLETGKHALLTTSEIKGLMV